MSLQIYAMWQKFTDCMNDESAPNGSIGDVKGLSGTAKVGVFGDN